ncbi:MAG: SIMPL domain-containing protein [Patescibacteria group bacterium]
MVQTKNNNKHSFFSQELFLGCQSACYFLIILLIALTFWIGAKFFNEIKIFNRPNLNTPTISVSGEGKIFARPDVGRLSFSAEAESLDVAEAQRSSAEVINNAIKFLRNSGFAEQDLKTASYAIAPFYDFPKGRREFRGYRVSQSMEIKIRDLGKTGAILKGLAAAGVKNIGALNFEIDQTKDVQNQARQKAIEDAKKKAQELASVLGVRLGKIVSFSESGQTPPIFALKTFGAAENEFGQPEVPVGENEIAAFVTLVFELK